MMNITDLERAYEEASASHTAVVNHKIAIYEQLSPLNGTAKFITCRNCQSKLNVQQMKKHKIVACRLACPVCKSKTSLYSTTSNNRLEATEKKYIRSLEKLQKCRNRMEKEKGKETESSQWEGIQKIRERLEIIYSETKTLDYVELKGEIGGDMLCYRIYNSGFICEK